MSYTYILRCADGTLYTGWAKDPYARLARHNSGKGAKYTRSRLPAELVYLEELDSPSLAMSRECHIKKLSRQEKLQLIEEYKKQREKS